MQMDLYRVIKSLRDRERGVKPDPAWIRRTRETLLMQVANTMPTPEAAAIRRRMPAFSAFKGTRFARLLRAPAVASLSLTVVALGGSIASVSAAERALPGDTLYSVKLVTEQARLALTSSKPDKIKLKAEFAIRRVEELKTIVRTPVSKKEERAAQAADMLKRDLDTLKQQLTEVQAESSGGGAAAADAAKTVDKNAVEVVKALNETKNELSPEVKEKVAAAQAQAADVGIKALEVMAGARSSSGGAAVSNSDLGSSLAAHAEVASSTAAEVKALTGSATSSSVAPATAPLVGGTTTTALQLARDAEQSLSGVQKLVDENKLDEAVGLVKDATSKSFTAQKQMAEAAVALASASSSAIVGSASSTADSIASTSTMNGTSPSSTTAMTTTTTKQ